MCVCEVRVDWKSFFFSFFGFGFDFLGWSWRKRRKKQETSVASAAVGRLRGGRKEALLMG